MNDYSQPIQYLIDDGLYWELVPGIRKKADIYIRQNLAEIEDSYIQLGFKTSKKFYQVQTTSERFESESSSGDVLSIYIRYDKTSDKYERQIYSLGELVGQAGGFYGALIGLGSIFIFIFSERLFASSVLKKIYQIDSWQETEMLSGKHKNREFTYNKKNPNFKYRPDGRKIKEPITESEKFHATTFDEIKTFSKQPEETVSSLDAKKDILSK